MPANGIYSVDLMKLEKYFSREGKIAFCTTICNTNVVFKLKYPSGLVNGEDILSFANMVEIIWVNKIVYRNLKPKDAGFSE